MNCQLVFDLLEDDTAYYVVAEYLKGGSLLQRLSQEQELCEGQIGDIVF